MEKNSTSEDVRKNGVRNRFKDMLSKADFKSIVSFCLNDCDSFESDLENYQTELDTSETVFFDEIEKLFPELKENEKFYEIYSELLIIHEETYFEIGLLAGMIFNEDIKQKYSNLLKDNEIGSNILKWLEVSNIQS